MSINKIIPLHLFFLLAVSSVSNSFAQDTTTVLNQTAALIKQGQYDEAKNGLDSALLRTRKPEEQKLLRTQLSAMHRSQAFSFVYEKQQFQAGIEHYQAAYAINKDLNLSDAASDLEAMWIPYFGMGQHQEALNALQQALKIRQQLNQKQQEQKTLSDIGLIYLTTGQAPKAVTNYRRALTMAEENGDQESQANVLNNLQLCYMLTSQWQEMVQVSTESIAIPQQDDKRANSLFFLSLANVVLEQYEEAQDNATKAAVLFEQIGNRASQCSSLLLLSEANLALGLKNQALIQAKRAAAIALDTTESADQLSAIRLLTLSNAYIASNLHQDALAAFQKALALCRALKSDELTARCLEQIGSMYVDLNKPEDALPYLEEARSLARKNNSDGEGTALRALGRSYNAMSRYQEGLRFLQQALPLIQKRKYPEDEASLWEAYADSYRGLKQPDEALKAAEKAKNLLNGRKSNRQQNRVLEMIVELQQNASGLRGAPVKEGAEAKPKAPLSRNYALLVATDTYDSAAYSPLSNPVPDAEAVKAELDSTYDFQCTLLKNPTYEQVVDKLNNLRENLKPQDRLLVFFAGHGDYDVNRREGFLIMKNSEHGQYHNRSLSHSELRQRLLGMPCRQIMVILDSCFSGTFDGRMESKSRSARNPYEEKTPVQYVRSKSGFSTFKYFTAGGKEYVSDGLPGRHSPFVRGLLEALRSKGGNGVLTCAEIQQALEGINPSPHSGTIADLNDSGSDFVLFTSEIRTLLNAP